MGRFYESLSSPHLHDDGALARDCPPHISFKGKRTHDWICDQIHNAKREIYIENQYLVSGNGIFGDIPLDTDNKIMNALIERIKQAVRSKDEFNVTIITNIYFPDELISEMMMKSMMYGSVRYLRSQIKCDDATFQRYVTILVPNESANTMIHSKLWVFDRETIMCGSGNIIDRSFSDAYGDYEMAWIFDSNTYDVGILRATYDAIREAAPIHQTYRYTEYYKPIDSLTYLAFRVSIPIIEDWRKITGTKQSIE